MKHTDEIKLIREMMNMSRESVDETYFLPFDINSIPIEQLRKQYIDYGTHLPITQYGKLVVEDDEGTTPIKELLDIIRGKYLLEEWQCIYAVAHNNIEVALIVPNTESNKKLIISEMDNNGYFLGQSREITREDMKWLQIQFEPRVTKSLNDEIKYEDVLYHISAYQNKDAILSNGILPSNENEYNGKDSGNRPKMVFLLREHTSRIQWKNTAIAINNSRPEHLKTNSFVVFEITVSKLPEDIKFQGDPEHPSGVCTYSPIPPTAISYLTQFQI